MLIQNSVKVEKSLLLFGPYIHLWVCFTKKAICNATRLCSNAELVSCNCQSFVFPRFRTFYCLLNNQVSNMLESRPKNHNNAKLRNRSYVFQFATSIYASPCIENLAKLTETIPSSCFPNTKIFNLQLYVRITCHWYDSGCKENHFYIAEASIY